MGIDGGPHGSTRDRLDYTIGGCVARLTSWSWDGTMRTRVLRAILRRFHLDLGVDRFYPPDFEPLHIGIIEQVRPYTITSYARQFALIEAVRYVLDNNIPGGFVECGVYKGGSMMAVALTLLSRGVRDRDLYLFDTFAGMPTPSEKDVSFRGRAALEVFPKYRLSDNSSTWTNCPLDRVKEAMSRTGYPSDKIHYIQGMVEDTLPERAPGSIALLRLDTDWYQSTRHELIHLYPLVSPRGVTIVDDYGYFKGARDAVDEYFPEIGLHPYLHRMDHEGRLIIKTA
jgi:O-methyltransferase